MCFVLADEIWTSNEVVIWRDGFRQRITSVWLDFVQMGGGGGVGGVLHQNTEGLNGSGVIVCLCVLKKTWWQQQQQQQLRG